MHELSICNSMVGIVRRYAEGRSVRTVRVRIGAMRQIVPETLVYCWSLVTEASELAGVELLVERVPAKIRCARCGREQTLDEPVLRCETCPDATLDLVQGDEFLITSLDLAEV
ncbi:hydrogenase maturation nickel metallochaperone HypA [Mycolicibacterium cosmeticum]|uniref:hydrogenase maturation nickel metallochaperone HypA/HybF n=1 Tax=Mycolicibacterium cosmeticum TaxID=258533 RepID=UPI003204C2DB